jgi:uncharacterized protein YecE (DUF72 family)
MIRIGTAGWAVPARVRDRFPEAGTGLERYASRFAGVEINSTFYRSHKPQTFERWAAAVPDSFRFAIKMPKAITHERRLVDVDPLVECFLEELSAIGDKLGPLLIQLPPSLAFDAAVARDFLEALRGRTKGSIACEPRHPSWFDRQADLLLSDFGIARVAADPARVPEAGLPGGAQDLIYYRLHGSPRMYYSEYGEVFAQDLATRVMAEGAAETWCIFDNTTSGAAASDALLLQQRLARDGLGRTG